MGAALDVGTPRGLARRRGSVGWPPRPPPASSRSTSTASPHSRPGRSGRAAAHGPPREPSGPAAGRGLPRRAAGDGRRRARRARPTSPGWTGRRRRRGGRRHPRRPGRRRCGAVRRLSGSLGGELRLGAEQVANHVASVTRAHLQAGLRVHGDRAMTSSPRVCAPLPTWRALPRCTPPVTGSTAWELVDAAALAPLVLLGLRAVVAPALSSGPLPWPPPAWAAARRLRLALADLAAAGVPLALGSGTTGATPWAAVRAAVLHPRGRAAHLGPGGVPRSHARGLAAGRPRRLSVRGDPDRRTGPPGDLARRRARGAGPGRAPGGLEHGSQGRHAAAAGTRRRTCPPALSAHAPRRERDLRPMPLRHTPATRRAAVTPNAG